MRHVFIINPAAGKSDSRQRIYQMAQGLRSSSTPPPASPTAASASIRWRRGCGSITIWTWSAC